MRLSFSPSAGYSNSPDLPLLCRHVPWAMYAELPVDRRSAHPYHMYDEIKEQPRAVAASFDIVREQGADVGALLARARRIILAGSGTSLHVAQVGAWGLRAFSGDRVDALAVQSYELVTYGPRLRPDDVLVAVTHSGGSTMTNRGIQRAREAGAETVVITGFPDSPAGLAAAHVLPTGYAEEHSWAHTASYTAAVTALLALANGLAGPEERLDFSPLSDVVHEALQLEEMIHRIAASAILMERYHEPSAVVVVGAGVNAYSAHEAVLKLLETSYVHAGAFELEQMLHGPLAAITPDTLVIVLAPAGKETLRAAELVRALQAIGVTPVVLCSDQNAETFGEAHRLLLPELPEVLSPIPYIVPLQLFSYFLAVGKGANPDLLHREDERYRDARAQYA